MIAKGKQLKIVLYIYIIYVFVSIMGCRYYYASNLNSLTEAPTDGYEFKLVIKLTLETGVVLILYLFNVTFPDCSNHICSCLETKELKS